MMSIQLLYSRQVPRTINCDPAMLQRSAGAVGSDEILAILSKVQHEFPIGDAVLGAQIALDESAKRSLVRSLAQSLVDNSVDSCIAKALSETAVFEVCDSSVCPRCKGTGMFVKSGVGLIECSKCHGVGNFIMSGRALHKMVLRHLPEDKKFSRDTFTRKWYDTYMSITDRLHTEAGEASTYAKSILRVMEEQAAYA